MAFNLPGIQHLNLSRHHIVGIYNGTITSWNDSSISEINPEISLPDAPIMTVARAEKSGTTEIFTSALSSIDENWNRTYGTFSAGIDENDQPYYWNPDAISYYGKTNRGISGLLLSLRYTIAYLSVADAVEAHLTYARIINREGELVGPDSDSIQSAMDVMKDSFTHRFTVNLVDVPGKNSYPFAGYSYFVLYQSHPNGCKSAVALYRYMKWFIFDEKAQSDSKSLDFVPLSATIGEKVMAHLDKKFTCEGGSMVSDLAAEQEAYENRVIEPWKLPVIITSVIVAFILVLLIVHVIQRELKLNTALLKGHWKIPLDQISQLKNSNVENSSASFSRSDHFIPDKDGVEYEACGSKWEIKPLNIGHYNARRVWLQPSKIPSLDRLKISTRRVLLWSKNLHHTNIAQFFGVTQIHACTHFVMSYDTNGLLHDVLHNDKYHLDDNFKFCLALDVVAGMAFLHSEDIIHGDLTAASCCIDERWNVKISDWAYYKVAQKQDNIDIMRRDVGLDENVLLDKNYLARKSFWQAPEVLKNSKMLPTKEADIFSFSMLLLEIFSRSDPYSTLTDQYEPVDILQDVILRDIRPDYPHGSSPALQKIFDQCWATDPNGRPNFKKLKKLMEKAKPSKKGVLDCLMEALEIRTKELDHAIDGMQALLHQILPPSVAHKLQNGESVDAESYESVTIYFSDIVGFTRMSSLLTPMQVVQFLNCLYTCFDKVLDLYDVYKVETIGDAYMVISGLPNRNGILHAGEIASMALELMAAAAAFKIPNLLGDKLLLRAGMHSGPVASGVVGLKMPRFCLFGDTVNTASRMESTSAAMKVQVSEDCKTLLDQIGGYVMERRGTVSVKVMYVCSCHKH